MCGIVGYVGHRRADDFLLEGLRRLEYRGYDSAGIATLTPDGQFPRRQGGRPDRRAGRRAGRAARCPARLGIGHTRWATHGVPTRGQRPSAFRRRDRRAAASLALAHNGVIENYLPLKEKLLGRRLRVSSARPTPKSSPT